jgi:hypothetical protein
MLVGFALPRDLNPAFGSVATTSSSRALPVALVLCTNITGPRCRSAGHLGNPFHGLRFQGEQLRSEHRSSRKDQPVVSTGPYSSSSSISGHCLACPYLIIFRGLSPFSPAHLSPFQHPLGRSLSVSWPAPFYQHHNACPALSPVSILGGLSPSVFCPLLFWELSLFPGLGSVPFWFRLPWTSSYPASS